MSTTDDVIPLIEPREQHGAEIDRPDAVARFLESDTMLLQRVRDEEQAIFEAEGRPRGPAQRCGPDGADGDADA